MKIGFDAKRIFHNSSGLGNYGRTIIRQLSTSFPHNEYYLYNPKKGGINFSLNSNTKEVLPIGMINNVFNSAWRSNSIVKQLVDDKIDIYHGLSSELPSGIKKAPLKTVVTVHDLIFKYYPENYKSIDVQTYNYKTKNACINADVIIAISEQTKKDIIKFYNIDQDKIEVVYQGCSQLFKQKYSAIEKETTRKKFKLPNQFILNVGTIEPRKNITTIVKAIRNMEDVHLVIVGGKQKKYFTELIKLINEYEINDRVHILSNVCSEDLAKIYQLASLLVYPSIYEGFGIPIIEALESRLPVIAATGSCLEEAGGQHSIYCNPKDEMQFKNAIENIINNKEKKQIMVAEGLKHAENFKDEVITRLLMTVYQKINNARSN